MTVYLNPEEDPKNHPFVLYSEYADNCGSADIIYVGNDKAVAFDELIKFLKSECPERVFIIRQPHRSVKRLRGFPIYPLRP